MPLERKTDGGFTEKGNQIPEPQQKQDPAGITGSACKVQKGFSRPRFPPSLNCKRVRNSMLRVSLPLVLTAQPRLDYLQSHLLPCICPHHSILFLRAKTLNCPAQHAACTSWGSTQSTLFVNCLAPGEGKHHSQTERVTQPALQRQMPQT